MAVALDFRLCCVISHLCEASNQLLLKVCGGGLPPAQAHSPHSGHSLSSDSAYCSNNSRLNRIFFFSFSLLSKYVRAFKNKNFAKKFKKKKKTYNGVWADCKLTLILSVLYY